MIYTTRQFIFLSGIFLSAVFSESQLLAGPRVAIVIGDKAPALERLAADELSSQLKRVYEADVKIASTAPGDAPHVIFVGSPDTNASMKPFSDTWPSGNKKLTDQGHLLRSVTHKNKPALLIGGGSPVATYWAVAEFGHQLGIRSMLFGDLDPVSPPEFKLRGIDRVMEPIVRPRGWFFWNSYYSNDGGWSLDEYQRVFRQLAKLRFNEITVAIREDQPYLHLEFGGIRQSSSSALRPIVVSGDTSGRKSFGGAKLFETPAFAGTQAYTDRHAAAKKRLSGIIDAAHEFDMTVNVLFPFESVPREFDPLLPAAKPDHLGRSLISLGWDTLVTNKKVAGLFKAHTRSLIETYPKLDGLRIFSASIEPSEEIEAFEKFSSQPGFLRRADGRNVRVTWLGVSDEPVGLVVRPLDPVKDVASSGQSSIVNFGKGTNTTLPRIRPNSWVDQWWALSKQGSQGYEVQSSHLGDDDLPAYWISRASFGQMMTPQAACRELLSPVCGDEVDHRVWRAFELMQSASTRFGNDSGIPEKYHLDLSDPLNPFYKDEPVPAIWSEARDNYLNAMNEMYRANTRAREGGRSFTLYFARRFEFAFEYMNCIEAVRKAAIAEQTKDAATQIAELEKAIESLNNGLNAMAAVARSNSDRGLIAVLNEYGYRPLKKKLVEVEAAAK